MHSIKVTHTNAPEATATTSAKPTETTPKLVFTKKGYKWEIVERNIPKKIYRDLYSIIGASKYNLLNTIYNSTDSEARKNDAPNLRKKIYAIGEALDILWHLLSPFDWETEDISQQGMGIENGMDELEHVSTEQEIKKIFDTPLENSDHIFLYLLQIIDSDRSDVLDKIKITNANKIPVTGRRVIEVVDEYYGLVRDSEFHAWFEGFTYVKDGWYLSIGW